MFRESEAEQKSLKKKRDAIAARLTEAWKNEFPEVQSAVFPSARIDRATRRTITTKDKPAILKKLDGLDRLDIAEPVVNEMELLALSRTGALDGLSENVIVIDDVPEIRVRRRKDI
jgi:hypothetical protein